MVEGERGKARQRALQVGVITGVDGIEEPWQERCRLSVHARGECLYSVRDSLRAEKDQRPLSTRETFGDKPSDCEDISVCSSAGDPDRRCCGLERELCQCALNGVRRRARPPLGKQRCDIQDPFVEVNPTLRMLGQSLNTLQRANHLRKS
jgi:hypothetical protein